MARRPINVFGLAFLDAMTCGFGAVILIFMVVSPRVHSDAAAPDTPSRAEVDRLDEEVLEGHLHLAEVRNSLRDIDEQRRLAQGLMEQVVAELAATQTALATASATTTAHVAHIEKLAADLKSLEEGVKRLSAASPSRERPGRRLRSFVGDGDRQYLTGLRVGGRHIVLLLDTSASMLAETVVNIVRRRHLPDNVKMQADKWQQAVSTVDWITTQIPAHSRFQIYSFNETAQAVVAHTEGRWLDGGRREDLDRAVRAVRAIIPAGGTNLYRAFASLATLQPPPDNLILLTDGLPTLGRDTASSGKVSGKQRLRLFRKALDVLPRGLPVNVILLPMEGDPMAASAFWQLATGTNGSFLSPAADWP